MTEDTDGADREPGRYRFSEGAGFSEPYESFDLDPPELGVDPASVDPVDSRVIADALDQRQIGSDQVDSEELLDVGLSYMRINRFEQATEAFERAARFGESAETEIEAWVNKGAAHAELEEWDEAIGAHREAIHRDREAREEATEGVDRDGDGAERRRATSEHVATAHTNLAYALWESGETSQALDHAEKAIEIDERFAEGWYNRAFFLAERGLSEEALHCLDNAIRLGLRSPPVLEEKVRVLEELGEDDEAEALAEEANDMRERAEARLVEERESMRE